MKINIYGFAVINFILFNISIVIIASWLYHKFSNLYEKEHDFRYRQQSDLLGWSFNILSNLILIEEKIEDKDQFIQTYKEIDYLLSNLHKNYNIVELNNSLKILQKKLNSFSSEEVDYKIGLLKKYEEKYDKAQKFVFNIEKNLPLLDRFNSLDIEKLLININLLTDITHKMNDIHIDDNNISIMVEKIEPKSKKLEKLLENCQNKKNEFREIIQYFRDNKKELNSFFKQYNTFNDIKNSSMPFVRYWRLINNVSFFVIITILSVSILLFAYIYNENHRNKDAYENFHNGSIDLNQNKNIKKDILKEINAIIDNRMNEIKNVHIETLKLSNHIDQKREKFLKKMGQFSGEN